MKTNNYNSAASEELSSGGFDFEIIDNYHLIKIGATTVNQLQEAKIIPTKNYGSLLTNKPDGLIIKGRTNVQVLIELKKPGSLKSIENAKDVITGWYYDLAKLLGCKILCASDGKTTCWIHVPSTNFYSQNGAPIKETFKVSDFTESSSDHIKRKIVSLIEKMNSSNKMGEIKSPDKELNPQKLADRVWQKIWIQTGKNPESCLYMGVF